MAQASARPSTAAPARKTRAAKPAAPRETQSSESVAAPTEAAAPAVVEQPIVMAEPEKPSKDALVRDSFTIPASEYAVLAQLKQRSIALSQPAKKSEVLRAGLMALAALDDADLLSALACVPAIKTGRPKARKTSKKA